jgi:hypothetical protein
MNPHEPPVSSGGDSAAALAKRLSVVRYLMFQLLATVGSASFLQIFFGFIWWRWVTSGQTHPSFFLVFVGEGVPFLLPFVLSGFLMSRHLHSRVEKAGCVIAVAIGGSLMLSRIWRFLPLLPIQEAMLLYTAPLMALLAGIGLAIGRRRVVTGRGSRSRKT